MDVSCLQVDDELKKIKQKDPKFMTARQRAMFGKKIEKDDISEQPVPRSSKCNDNNFRIVKKSMLNDLSAFKMWLYQRVLNTPRADNVLNVTINKIKTGN